MELENNFLFHLLNLSLILSHLFFFYPLLPACELLYFSLILFSLQVFIAISLILGDGLYNLVKIIGVTVKELCNSSSKQKSLPVVTEILGKNCEI